MSFLAVAKVNHKEQLKLVTLHNPPLAYEENGQLTGAIVEVVKEVVKRTGRKVLISMMPWKRAQREVELGRQDGVFNTGNTAWRREWAYFNDDVLFAESYALFTIKNKNVYINLEFDNVADLQVGIQRGYVYGEKFQQALDNEKFKGIATVETIQQNIQKLIKNRVDLFIGDLIPTIYYLKQTGILDKVSIVKQQGSDKKLIISVWPTYMAFSKNTISKDYVKRFNRALVEMKRDGTSQKIFDKFIGRERF